MMNASVLISLCLLVLSLIIVIAVFIVIIIVVVVNLIGDEAAIHGADREDKCYTTHFVIVNSRFLRRQQRRSPWKQLIHSKIDICRGQDQAGKDIFTIGRWNTKLIYDQKARGIVREHAKMSAL